MGWMCVGATYCTAVACLRRGDACVARASAAHPKRARHASPLRKREIVGAGFKPAPTSWAIRRARSLRPSAPPAVVDVTPAFRAGALLVLERATHICVDDANRPLPPPRPDRPTERIAGGDRGHAAIILAPGNLDRPGEVGDRERQQRSHKHKHPRHGSRISGFSS
jgi:hypothetical protein